MKETADLNTALRKTSEALSSMIEHNNEFK